MILAGGLGTRLGPVLGKVNKPMVPVGDRPFLEYLIHNLRRQGLRDVILCVGFRHEVIQDHFASGTEWDVRLRYAVEDTLLGTAGAIKQAEPLIASDNFLVMNGDSFCDVDLQALIAHHLERRALATVALRQTDDAGRYGAVHLDESGHIVRFEEKSAARLSGLMNCGIYVFHRDVLSMIPRGGPVSLEREVFPRLVGTRFQGFIADGYFIDIGIIDDYQRLQRDPSKLIAALNGRE